ncbi:alkaline phosphatase family protein [bacterium]|nr:alkaline phosphatase family protein [bacterium]
MNSCIFIMADGAKPDVLSDLLQKGDLPNIERYLMEPGSYRTMVSVIPATTGSAYLPFLTGCYPGTCNMPGIRWFDRKTFSQKRFSLYKFRSYVGFESYLYNHDISKEVKTIFELAGNPVNIFNSINRGVGFWGNKTKLRRGIHWLRAHHTANWQKTDATCEKILVRVIGKNHQFILALFPSIDTLSHLTHPTSEIVLDAYRRLDNSVGKVVRCLRKLGKLEETLIILTSDHGLSQTYTHLGLVDLIESLGLKTLFYPLIFKWNPQAVVMESGNGMANLYFRNGNGWDEPCYYHNLRKYGYSKIDLIEFLLQREEIALLVSRDIAGGIIVNSREGEAQISTVNNQIQYRLLSGRDPFGYADFPFQTDFDSSLELTFDTDYPDAITQLIQIFRSPRTGDLLVSAKDGFDLRTRFENPEHKSSHGSLSRSHLLVPYVSNVNITTKRKLRTVDVFPSILKLLGLKIGYHPIDGKSFVE